MLKQKKIQYFNEVNILKKINHCNIIKLLNNIDTEYCLEIPYYKNGSVFDCYFVINYNNKEFDRLNFIKRLSIDTCYALEHLHSIGITHTDIKKWKYSY